MSWLNDDSDDFGDNYWRLFFARSLTMSTKPKSSANQGTVDKPAVQKTMDDRDLDQFNERKPHRNVALIVEDRRFWIPRDSLADHSPVFATKLFGEDSNKEEIELTGQKAEHILEMLRCLFPKDGSLKEISYENVVALTKLANEYQIAVLDRRCMQFIESMAEGHQVIRELFLDGVKFGLKKVVRACLPLLARFDLNELRLAVFDQVPEQVKSAIFYQILSQGTVISKCRTATNAENDCGAFALMAAATDIDAERKK